MEKPIVNAAAASLSEAPWFAGGENAPYSLYAYVPLQFIRHGKSTDVREDSGDVIIDLLICKGRRHEVVFAILLGEDDSPIRIGGPLMSCMNSTDYLFLRTEPAPAQEDAAKVCAQLLEYVNSKLHSVDTARFSAGGSVPVLPSIPADDVMGDCGGETLPERMARARLLSRTAAITDYGRACGLFWQYDSQNSRHIMLAAGEAGHFKEALSWGMEKLTGKTPLAKRLKRLERVQPSDDVYGAHLTTLLRRMLDAPLEDFCADNAECPKQHLAQIEAVMGKIPCSEYGLLKKGYTYRDALAAIRSLHRACMMNPAVSARWYEIKKNALFELGEQILLSWDQPQSVEPGQKQSLTARLGQFHNRLQKKYPITCQPIPASHYYYAAAMLAGSDYPNWLYVNRVRPHMGIKDGQKDEDFCLYNSTPEQCQQSMADRLVYLQGTSSG